MNANTLLYLLLTLVLLSIMVVIHELGHFLFAKLFKVTVLEFSVGMGPAIFTTGKRKKKKVDNDNAEFAETFKPEDEDNGPKLNTSALGADKTIFSIRALPIGGYVSMAGEDDASDDPNAFHKKKVWQRLVITVAGALMNIVLGVLCMTVLVSMEGIQTGHLASNTIHSFHSAFLIHCQTLVCSRICSPILPFHHTISLLRLPNISLLLLAVVIQYQIATPPHNRAQTQANHTAIPPLSTRRE